MDKILDVKNLQVSFRTPDGIVRAVRDINFELKRGETLAIVGESGSGKSVTSRAILGILAPNSIVESGHIIFDGQDLLKISEEDFHNIRGEKISMIFQDPLSSLNPIVKIGKQLTEAMIIKGKTYQEKARAIFNEKLQLINMYMDLATGAESNPAVKEANANRIKTFDTFELEHTKLEHAYNVSYEAVEEGIDEIENIVLEIQKKAAKLVSRRTNEIAKKALKAINRYVVHDDAEKLTELCQKLTEKAKTIEKTKAYEELVPEFTAIKEILETAHEFKKPKFFAMAYHVSFSGQPLPEMPVAELNKYLVEYLNTNFMNEFTEYVKKALEYSFNESLQKKKQVLNELTVIRKKFNESTFVKEEVQELAKDIISKVEDSIDRLAIRKDSTAYTFGSSLNSEIKNYFHGIINNVKEQKRFDKESAKHASLTAKGKNPEWKVVPLSLTDLDLIKVNIIDLIDNLYKHYQESIAEAETHDFVVQTIKTIDFLREKCSEYVKTVTKSMAKLKALKIMEEVGIPEPRKRFNQYPFQFSGGMRQRIVIAIALTAHPEILICDEPTTALDVTIQAQILELINGLKKKHGLSIIFITHDLGVVANMADRIAVMYAGKIVEYGKVDEVFYAPAHPYTWALLSSMPDLDTKEKLDAIPGTPPNMIFPPVGDAFAARNKYALKIDFEEQPPMFKITDTHYAATWLLHPDAPKVEMPKIVSERIKRNKQLFAEQNKADGEGVQ